MKQLFILFFLLINFAIQAQTWEWAKGFGSNQVERGWELAVGPNNEIIVTGRYTDTLQIGDFILPHIGLADFFIASFDTDGNVNWANRISGKGEEIGIGTDCDSEGNVYAIGYFTDTITVHGQTYIPQSWEVFIVSYDKNGDFRWLYQPKSDGYEVGYGLAVSGVDNIYATGWFQGDLIIDEADTLHCYGSSDIFLLKLNKDGELLWGNNYGGEQVDYGFKVAADNNDQAYLTGVGGGDWIFNNLQFYKTPGMFLARLQADGTADYVIHGNGAGSLQIACDDFGNAYVAGRMTDTADFENFHFVTFEGSDDGYTAKANADGSWENIFALQANGNIIDRAVAVPEGEYQQLAVGASISDTLVVAGEKFIAEVQDILIIGYSKDGAQNWALQAGGPEVDVPSDMAYDTDGNIIVTGWYTGQADFGDYHLTGESFYDMNFFIAKISSPQSIDKQINTGNEPNIFPNPTSNLLQIESRTNTEAIKYRLLSGNGSLVLEGRLSNNNSIQSINLSSLPKGSYILEMISGSQKSLHKIIKN